MLLPPGDRPPTGPRRSSSSEPCPRTRAVGRFLATAADRVCTTSRTATDGPRSRVCRLAESGMRLIYAVPRAGTRGSRINFVHPKDTGGTLIELVEPAVGSERQHR